MKHVHLTFSSIFILLCLTTTLPAQFRYGIRAGINLGGVQYSGNEDTYAYHAYLQRESKPLLNASIGGLAEYDFQKNITLSGELQFTGKGYRLHSADQPNNPNTDFTNYTVQLWYLQVPLACNVRIRGIFAGAGPFGSLGLTGSAHYELLDVDGKTVLSEQKDKVVFGQDETAYFRRFDYGLYAHGGYSFRNFRLVLSYYFSLGNTVPEFFSDADGVSARYRTLVLSAAYFFGAGE